MYTAPGGSTSGSASGASGAANDNWMIGALKDYAKTSAGRKDPFAAHLSKAMAKRKM